MKSALLDCFKTSPDVKLGVSAARGWFIFALFGAAVAPAAPLSYTIQANETINTVLVQPDLAEDMPGSTTLSTTTLTRPASLDYSGVNGTVTMDFLAPTGFKFVVNPQGDSRLRFQVAYTNFNAGGASGGITKTSSSISFLNPEGTTPVFSDFSTLGSIPHAYQAVSINASGLATPFSFTGLRYTFTISGTGTNVNVTYFEGGNMSVGMTGLAAGGPALLAVTAIPEPASATACAALAAGALVALRRRRRYFQFAVKMSQKSRTGPGTANATPDIRGE
ncbi:MAG: hypothetical protein NTU80_06535 [Verrucomicrobia bacterium]|nr:hypothetical protein [Verrucomicrobiota bacterium]